MRLIVGWVLWAFCIIALGRGLAVMGYPEFNNVLVAMGDVAIAFLGGG